MVTRVIILGSLVAALVVAFDVRAAEPAEGAPLEVQSVVLRLIAEAEVPAQEAGVLTAVAVHEGQRVKKGELLAQIDDQVAQMAEKSAKLAYDVARAKATNDVDLRYARKAADVAEAELARSNESIAKVAKSVSQSQVDVEKLSVDKSKLAAEQAEHEMQVATFEMNSKENEWAAAKLAVTRRKIVAPFDGVIVQIFVRLGEWVEPGQKMLRIVSVDKLKAEGFLPAEKAGAVAAGAPVQLTIDLADQHEASFGGTLAFVSPEVDPITRQVRVWAEIENKAGRLRPGQPVRMTIGKGDAVVRSP